MSEKFESVSFMEKKAGNFFMVFVIAISYNAFSQDTLTNNLSKKKLIISAYLDLPIFYTEPGLQVQYFFKEDHYVELKYGFDLFAYNISHDPYFGGGTIADFFSGYGSIIKFGYGYLKRDDERKIKRNIHEFRVTYKDMFFPLYKISDGSPGSSHTPVYSQSERKRTIVLNYILGKKLNKLYTKENYGIAFHLIGGVAYDTRRITRYSVQYSGNRPEEINSPPITKTSFRPSLGVEFIFYLKAYKKNY